MLTIDQVDGVGMDVIFTDGYNHGDIGIHGFLDQPSFRCQNSQYCYDLVLCGGLDHLYSGSIQKNIDQTIGIYVESQTADGGFDHLESARYLDFILFPSQLLDVFIGRVLATSMGIVICDGIDHCTDRSVGALSVQNQCEKLIGNDAPDRDRDHR